MPNVNDYHSELKWSSFCQSLDWTDAKNTLPAQKSPDIISNSPSNAETWLVFELYRARAHEVLNFP